MSFQKYIRKNVYRWHRVTSLVVALPVLLWTISGFLHPVMNSFKPDVKSQFITPVRLDTSKINLSLSKALRQNQIDSIINFRIVKLDKAYYYQLQVARQARLVYISCTDGAELKNGDVLYAEQLAMQFLNGNTGSGKITEPSCHNANNDIQQAAFVSRTRSTTIIEVKYLTRFDEEYKRSQKILPVYKVSFQRADDIRLYVETRADRLVYAVDSRKAWFTRFFSMAHSWAFLDGMGKTKSVLLGTFAFMCFATSVFGFYVYNITSKKKAVVKKSSVAKSFHRVAGNVFIVTTLLYAFSGGWHAFKKVPAQKDNTSSSYAVQFTGDELKLSLTEVCKCLEHGESLSNVSAAEVNGRTYWQVAYVDGQQKKGRKYVDVENGALLEKGDEQYACYLACRMGNKEQCVKQTKLVTAFNHEYSMMNKRLPVVQVTFKDNKSCFVETSTGTIAAVTNAADKAERFSFSNLHMHHYAEMWWGKETGKTVRNTILITTTLGLLLVALTGVILYIKKKWL